MAYTINSNDLTGVADDLDLGLEFVPAAADTKPQAYAEQKQRQRQLMTATLGEASPTDLTDDQKWGDVTQHVFAQFEEMIVTSQSDVDLDDVPSLNFRDPAAIVDGIVERKATGNTRNAPGSNDPYRYHGSSTGGAATHKVRDNLVNANAMADLEEVVQLPRGQAVSAISPKRGSRIPRAM